MAKDLTKLYSRPGAEAFHVFEDDNGQVQVKMGNRTAVTAVPSGSGVGNSGGRIALQAGADLAGGGVVTDSAPPPRVDVLIYGATPPGLMAAMRAAEHGVSVVIIEPTSHVGGMMTSGIGKTDMRVNASPRAACNGLTADVLKRAALEVGQENFEASYSDQWNYPCQVFDRVFRSMLLERGVKIYTGWRLKESGGVTVTGAQILGVTLEKTSDTGTVAQVKARQYIGAFTQPDLGRQAGITYTAGREATGTYTETNAGVTAANLTFTGVDPYVIAGDAGSGLLPGVTNSALPAAGTADSNGMWDCYRLVVTNDPANRVAFPDPKTYDAGRYELLRRWIVQGAGPQTLNNAITRYDIREDAFLGGSISAGKLIENWNNTNISFNRPGGYPGYWNATYAQRAAMDQDLRDYTLGLVKFLRENASVPSAIRNEIADWGLLAGEPYGADGLPPMPYRREGARMTSARYVVNQNDLNGSRVAPDPVAFGSYNADIHFCGAWFDSGVIKIEGLTTYSPPNRYPLDRGILLPSPAVVRNYQEAFCVGVSHVAWGSVRVDVTLMSLGEAAGAAAALAVKRNASVHEISGRDLRDSIGCHAHGDINVIAATGNAASLTGTSQAQTYGTITITGQWDYRSTPIGFPSMASGVYHDRGSGKGTKTWKIEPNITACGGAGVYDVFITIPAQHSADLDDSASAPFTVVANGVTSAITVDALRGEVIRRKLGTFRFSGVGGGAEYISLSNTGTTGRLAAFSAELVKVNA